MEQTSHRPAAAVIPGGRGARRNRWGAVLILVGLVLSAVGGGVGLWANEQRGRDGFLTSRTEPYRTGAFAVSLPWYEGEGDHGAGFGVLESMLGDFRIRMTPKDAAAPLFVGIGPAADVSRYLKGVGHDEISEIEFNPINVISTERPGAGPAGEPGGQTFWVASDTGPGPRTVTWDAGLQGDWMIVVMNADGSAGIDADLSVGATLPGIQPLAVGALITGGVLLMVGGAVIILTITRRRSAARLAR
jgi:hypothetical protein